MKPSPPGCLDAHSSKKLLLATQAAEQLQTKLRALILQFHLELLSWKKRPCGAGAGALPQGQAQGQPPPPTCSPKQAVPGSS